MKITQKGFTAVEGLLILVILAIIGGTGYYVWHSKNAANNTYNSATDSQKNVALAPIIKTFAGCKKADGSKIRDSYPEVCVTKADKSFTNPDQKPLPSGWTWFKSKNVKFAYPKVWDESSEFEAGSPYSKFITLSSDQDFAVTCHGCGGGYQYKYNPSTNKWSDADVSKVATTNNLDVYVIPINGDMNCGVYNFAIHFKTSFALLNSTAEVCTPAENPGDSKPPANALLYEDVVKDLKQVLQTLTSS